MDILIELCACLVPWLAVAFAVPVLLVIGRLVFRLMRVIDNALEVARIRKSFSPYVRRGFY